MVLALAIAVPETVTSLLLTPNAAFVVFELKPVNSTTSPVQLTEAVVELFSSVNYEIIGCGGFENAQATLGGQQEEIPPFSKA